MCGWMGGRGADGWISALNACVIAAALPRMLGLSQLHQLRGRVGRGRERAYAYFMPVPFGVPATVRDASLMPLAEASVRLWKGMKHSCTSRIRHDLVKCPKCGGKWNAG